MFFLSKNQWFLQFLHTCQQFLQPVFTVFTVFTNSQATRTCVGDRLLMLIVALLSAKILLLPNFLVTAIAMQPEVLESSAHNRRLVSCLLIS